MGALRIIFALTTTITLTNCYELSFVLDFPKIVDRLTELASSAVFSSRAQKDTDMDSPTLSEQLTKMSWDVFGFMSKLLNTVSRRTNYEQTRPNVEVGPGVIKSERVSYPPNYFVNRLKLLLKSQQKQEEMNKSGKKR